MKIHGMCLVKNEDDIIEQTLTEALKWCDCIYVFDNASTDTTWEKIQNLAKLNQQIIPYKTDGTPYHRDLVGEIFNYYRENASVGDWWCRLDADEFYIDDPRIFLAKIPAEFEMVYSASFEYYFTDKDLERYLEDPSLYSDDVPVTEKCRYYINNWSEPRFMKYRTDLEWGSSDGGWPARAWQAPAYPVRIWLRHYQYRSPQQIQKRIDTRRQVILSKNGFLHEAQSNWKGAVKNFLNAEFDFRNIYADNIPQDWKARIVSAESLNYDHHDRRFALREDLIPKIPIQKTPRNSFKRIFSSLT